jgi:DNA-binding MarR family transcriptional regulator
LESKHVCGGFKIINNYFENQLNLGLAEYNLTRSQMDVLIFLKINEKKNIETNQKDIEKAMSLKNPTVTGILDRLEDKGYIKRNVSSKDKRLKRITLTNASNEILLKSRNHAKKIEEKILSSLSDEEKDELLKLLDKIKINIKEEIC